MKRLMLLVLFGGSAFLAWRYIASSEATAVGDAAQPTASEAEVSGRARTAGPDARTELSDLAERDRKTGAPDTPPISEAKPEVDASADTAPEVDPAAAMALASARASAKLAEFRALAKQIAIERMDRGEYETVPFDAPSPEGERFAISSIDESGLQPMLRRVVLFGDETPELARLRDEVDATQAAVRGER